MNISLPISFNVCFWCSKDHIFKSKILNISIPISFNVCLSAQKNNLIETVLLSTHNICFV